MTAPSGTASGVGFRNLRIFALDENGYIAASNTTAYEGILVSGVKTLEINDPEPRLITHIGDDAPFALDVLPPTEAVSGALTVAKQNDILDAALTGLTSFTVGEMKMLGVGTDKRGYEVPVGALAYRQTEDTDPASSNFGRRNWQFKLMPMATFIPLEPGYTDAPEERRYTIRPGFSTKHIWGKSFSLATEGFTRAQIVRGISQYKPKLVAFLADGIEDEYLFPLDAQAASAGKTTVWVDGVERTSNITKATTGITFTSAIPTANQNITVLYETA